MEEADLTKNGYNYVRELKSLSIQKMPTKKFQLTYEQTKWPSPSPPDPPKPRASLYICVVFSFYLWLQGSAFLVIMELFLNVVLFSSGWDKAVSLSKCCVLERAVEEHYRLLFHIQV